jgi:hypothetical protein
MSLIGGGFEYITGDCDNSGKISVNENKGDAMTVFATFEVLPNQEFAWKCGRGEVLLAKLVTSPAFPFLFVVTV